MYKCIIPVNPNHDVITVVVVKYFLAEEAESQELAALENLLAKAQKAREVQAKVLYF